LNIFFLLGLNPDFEMSLDLLNNFKGNFNGVEMVKMLEKMLERGTISSFYNDIYGNEYLCIYYMKNSCMLLKMFRNSTSKTISGTNLINEIVAVLKCESLPYKPNPVNFKEIISLDYIKKMILDSTEDIENMRKTDVIDTYKNMVGFLEFNLGVINSIEQLLNNPDFHPDKQAKSRGLKIETNEYSFVLRMGFNISDEFVIYDTHDVFNANYTTKGIKVNYIKTIDKQSDIVEGIKFFISKVRSELRINFIREVDEYCVKCDSEYFQ
jgi:hypothetical protein